MTRRRSRSCWAGGSAWTRPSMGPHLILRAARRRMAELGVHELRDYAAQRGRLGGRAAGADRGGHRPGELVLPRRAAVPLAGGPCPRALDRGPVAAALARPEHALRRGPGALLDRHHAEGRRPPGPPVRHRRGRRQRPDARDRPPRRLFGQRLPRLVRMGATERGEGVRGEGRGKRDRSFLLLLAPRPDPSPLEGRWARHFRRQPQGYEIDPAIRSTVRFVQANVLDPALLADSPPYDVVFCRNLLIYLDDPRASPRAGDARPAAGGRRGALHRPRRPARGAGMPSRFAAVGEPGCFAYRRAAAPPIPAAIACAGPADPDAHAARAGADVDAAAMSPAPSPAACPAPIVAARPTFAFAAGAGRRAGQPGPARRGDRRLRAASPPQGSRGRRRII